LFRYSAMTFNGHRIHYDFPYATGVEGYTGLVVHGPMQATLMLNAAAQALGRPPKAFRYRGLSPLTAGDRFRVEALAAPEGLATRVVSSAGAATMSGVATAD
jgi:3-methylfumaryl-CoA hydratase